MSQFVQCRCSVEDPKFEGQIVTLNLTHIAALEQSEKYKSVRKVRMVSGESYNIEPEDFEGLRRWIREVKATEPPKAGALDLG